MCLTLSWRLMTLREDTTLTAKSRNPESESSVGLVHDPGPLHEGLPLPHSFPLSSKLAGSWPGAFSSPQEGKQVLREQIVPQRKEARLSQGPQGPACWLPGAPAIVTSVPRRSVSIRGPPSAPLPSPRSQLLQPTSPPPGSKCTGHGWKPVWLCWNC